MYNYCLKYDTFSNIIQKAFLEGFSMSYKRIVLLSLSLFCVSFQLEAMEEFDGMELEHKIVADKKGWTDLHKAAWRGDLEETKFLVQKGTNVNAPDNKGNTPLHLAAQFTDTNPAVYECLRDNGGDTNARNHAGLSPWGIIVTRKHRELTTKNAGKGLDKYGW